VPEVKEGLHALVIGGMAKVDGRSVRIFTGPAMYQQPIVRSLTVLAVLTGVTLLVYLPTLQWSLLSDDFDMVWGTGQGRSSWHHGFFRPISFLSFRMVHELWGDGAFAHRIFNMLVHGVNAFLVFLLTRSLCDRERISNNAAWMAALLFIVYPFHQEAIVWCVGRYPSMATAFMLGGVLVASSAHRWPLKVAFVLSLYVVAALTYEIALCLPFLVLVLLRQRNDPLRPWVVGFVLTTMALLAGRWLIVGDWSSGYLRTLLQHDGTTYAFAVPKALLRLVLPPCEDTRRQAVRSALLLFAIAVLGWKLKAARSIPLSRSVLYLLLAMLLLSSWLALLGGVSTRTSESDRFLYLPSVFLCVIIGLFLSGLEKGVLRWGLASALLAISFVALRANHRNWAVASVITASTIDALEREQARGPLEVNGLPDEFEGAFIFRHGVNSAMLLHGVDTSRVQVVGWMTRSDMLASGIKDTIDQRFDRGGPVGQLMSDGRTGTTGRSHLEWRP
jgi:hypothetical protein